jgi:hypothetical protein
MRFMGIALAVMSVFFLTRNITLSQSADWFFAFGAILGGVTLLASFLPSGRTNEHVEVPVMARRSSPAQRMAELRSGAGYQRDGL